MSGTERFDESTNRTYGVVDDAIPEEDIYRHDENPVSVSQFDEDGQYWLHIGSRVGLDTTIMFDSVRWEPNDYGGTLWFERSLGDEELTTGNIDWHPATPMRSLGLVGEWLSEMVDLSEYRSGVDCPECDGEILHIRMHSTCESVDCDFYCEGQLPSGWQQLQEADRDD